MYLLGMMVAGLIQKKYNMSSQIISASVKWTCQNLILDHEHKLTCEQRSWAPSPVSLPKHLSGMDGHRVTVFMFTKIMGPICRFASQTLFSDDQE